ncbi:hypothetical protein ACFYXM_18780 [Streptomyces sp. NPDC002476]|uniref:hypothetical protein n=1 Tax=Streptomyces sp. NPDC002476 TaxID=3364648 RepID=UPI003697236E
MAFAMAENGTVSSNQDTARPASSSRRSRKKKPCESKPCPKPPKPCHDKHCLCFKLKPEPCHDKGGCTVK